MDNDTLRRICVWPGVTWDTKWGNDRVGSVAGKMFCCLGDGRLSFKVEDQRFLELTDRPGWRPAPYLARARWVSVDDPATLAEGERDALLRRAYELVRDKLPRRVRQELDG